MNETQEFLMHKMAGDDELYHYGVPGMQWGVIRSRLSKGRAERRARNQKAKVETNYARTGNTIQKKNGEILSRKRSKYDDPAERKKRIDADIKEADDRVKYYGSKRAAKAAINDEAAYAKSVNRGKAAVNTFLYGGAGGLAGATLATLAVNTAAATVAGAAAPLLGVGLVSAAAAKKANSFIEKHKKDQILYTDESEYGHDIVVAIKKK